MANRFWVGDVVGGDIWSNANAWAAASGGAGGAGVPGAADDVYLDAASLRNCTLDVNTASLNRLDCNGYAQTLAQAGFVITVQGGVAAAFRLSAGMTFTHGNGLVDLVALAGTAELTGNGKTLGSLRTGNGGAGGTFKLMDALSLALDLSLVNGSFNFNGKNAGVGQDMLIGAGMGFFAIGGGAGTPLTITIGRTLTNLSATQSWSQFNEFNWRLTGTGQLVQGAGVGTLFYTLYLAAPGKTTTLVMANNTLFSVQKQMTTGSGTLFKSDGFTGNEIRIACAAYGLSDAFRPDPGLTWDTEGLDLRLDVGGWAAPLTIDLYPMASFQLKKDPGTLTRGFLAINPSGQVQPITLRLLAAMTYNAAGGFVFSSVSGVNNLATLDLNGLDLSLLGGTLTNGITAPAGGAWRFLVSGGKTLTVDAYNEYWPNVAGNQYHDLTGGGTFRVNGNYSYLGGGNTLAPRRYLMSASSVLSIGGNYNGLAMNTWAGSNLGTVRFTRAGALTIVQHPLDMWPVVEINGGAALTPPAGFNCYDFVVTNGTITESNRVTIRHVYTIGAAGVVNLTELCYLGSGFVTLPGATLNLAGNGALIPLGPGFSLTLSVVLGTITIPSEVTRFQITGACTITNLVIADRKAPMTMVLPAAAAVTITTLLTNSMSWPDTPVQVVSSTPGTQANLNIGALSSGYNLWPRDINFTGAVFVGDLTNKNLGNNTGPTFNGDGQLRFITDDPGADNLACLDIGTMEYCWLVATSVPNLTALAAAFAAGANNWHRRGRLPFMVVDNLNIGSSYVVSYGIRDDRNRRVAPNIGAGGYAEGVAVAAGGGGGGVPPKIVATSKFVF